MFGEKGKNQSLKIKPGHRNIVKVSTKPREDIHATLAIRKAALWRIQVGYEALSQLLVGGLMLKKDWV